MFLEGTTDSIIVIINDIDTGIKCFSDSISCVNCQNWPQWRKFGKWTVEENEVKNFYPVSFLSHDHVRNEKVLLRVNEQRNILHEISKRKSNWIGHILHRNCLLQGVIEGKIKGGIEGTGRRGRRRRKLLDDLKERRGYSHLKEEALDRAKWRAGFGRGFGPVVRQTAKWMHLFSNS